MNIAIIGYGKMGKAVERIAHERGHTTTIVRYNGGFVPEIEAGACIVEFTHAAAAPGIIRASIDRAHPVVSGTTGWDDNLKDITEYCLQHNGSLLWSPNFSIGMNLVFEMNKRLASMMDRRPEYDVQILEAHHTEKKDTPSGTAIRLADQIIDILRRKTHWVLEDDGHPDASALPIISERIPDVKGIHRVNYTGPHDEISLRHKAISRDAFAVGAVLAAEWLTGKVGVFTFNDVLQLS